MWLSMEKRRRLVVSTKSSLVLLYIVVVLYAFCLDNISAQCHSRATTHDSRETSSQFESPSLHKKRVVRRMCLSIFLGMVTGLVFAFLAMLLFRWFVKYLNRTPVIKGPVVFSPKIAPKTLELALENEPQILGASPNGKYYKAVLDNGLTVAVKRLEPFEHCNPQVSNKAMKRKVERELGVLAGLRHRNLMSLRAYVRESGGYSLVYDYVPTGSLQDTMKRVGQNQLQLKWESRLRIAVGIVKALHYLHFTCVPSRFHCNLKASNVMLDSEFEPRLADCGLAAVIPNFYRAASGYNAPECFQNFSYTEKSDVYSFGVILGVLLTGRDPLEQFFVESGGGCNLAQWLRHMQQAGEAREVLDKTILGEEVEEEEMLMAVRIAAVCLSDLPADRPSSDELVSMLTQLNSF